MYYISLKPTVYFIKDEVNVLWTAPDAGNGCIQLKARTRNI